MANVKDLLVNGSARVIGTIYGNATSANNADKLDGKHLSEIAAAKSTTLAWGASSTIATIGGNNITITMPTNPNTDTHYTTGITAGATGTISNSATTNGNTFIKIKDNSTHRGQIKIVGSGATSVSSDANGVITINSTDNNTTYGNATTSAAGLMSKDDKAKLDGITASADAVSFSRSLTSGTKVGTITINGTGTDIYAPTNTDTHWTTGLKVGASNTATANAAASNGSVYLNVLDNSTVRDSHKITGSGATSVTSDANGVITISSTNTTYGVATTSANGLMSASDKSKLDGIAAGANNYSHPTSSGNKHIPAGGSSGQILRWSADGTAAWGADTNTWRGIQNNLTSDSTTDSLAAAQGKALKALIDGKAASSHIHNYAGSASAGGSANSAVKLDTATVGDSNTPVYFSDGKPVACTSLDLNTSGNAATATNADTLDGYHANQLKSMFSNTDGFGQVYTFTKSVTIGTAWTRTGIISGDLPTGAYIIYMGGIWDTNKSWQDTNVYAGIMSWYSGGTNSSERSEIVLHTTGHAHNEYRIYLSTLSHGGNPVDSTTLEIKSNVAFTRATDITFKFIRMI